jgi:hypothetical protein
MALAVACATGAGVLAAAPTPAAAQEVVLQSEAARVAIAPYAAAASLGSRAELAANLGKVDASLTAAFERGGGGLTQADAAAWDAVNDAAAWTSGDVNLKAGWALAPHTQLNFEAGESERRTHNLPGTLGADADEQLATDQSSFMRVRAALQGERLSAQFGAENSTTAVDTQPLSAIGGGDISRQWLTARRLSASLNWRLSQQLSLEAGQTAQNLVVGWRGAGEVTSQASYLTPSLALAVAPSIDTKWRLEAEQTLSPIDPAQFAAYAQLATPGTGTAPQPDRGWRYGLQLERQLPGGVNVAAKVSDWRYASVTDIGPVGGGEAPVSIGPGARQQLDLNLKAPLSPLGFGGGATLAGELSWRRSQVADPFTGQRRAFSGEAPYSAQLRLSGVAPVSALSWSLIATADGPQNLYQMAQVTNLGATAGVGGALTYGSGPVQVSLQLDNLIGGSRQVTTYSYAGSRGDSSLSTIDRHDDDARAVRIMLKRGM